MSGPVFRNSPAVTRKLAARLDRCVQAVGSIKRAAEVLGVGHMTIEAALGCGRLMVATQARLETSLTAFEAGRRTAEAAYTAPEQLPQEAS